LSSPRLRDRTFLVGSNQRVSATIVTSNIGAQNLGFQVAKRFQHFEFVIIGGAVAFQGSNHLFPHIRPQVA